MAAALGNFDGVHLGHRHVIEPAVAYAQAMSSRGTSGSEQAGASAQQSHPHLYGTVITFTPHPQEFFTGQSKSLLTPLEEKLEPLQTLGVEQLVLLPFNAELAALSPQAFVEQLLLRDLQVRFLSVGEDFHFGAKRRGSVADLVALTANRGVQLHRAPLIFSNEEESIDPHERISSSRIRVALQEGNVALAQALLGRAYGIRGLVVPGQRLGRQLGFPTANLQVPANKFLPRQGVYAVWVSCLFPEAGTKLSQRPGVMNLGYRPTLAGQTLTAEVHLLDWSGDLYGQTLQVDLVQFLRGEQKFESLEALKAQIQQDCDRARLVLWG